MYKKGGYGYGYGYVCKVRLFLVKTKSQVQESRTHAECAKNAHPQLAIVTDEATDPSQSRKLTARAENARTEGCDRVFNEI